MCPRAAVRGQLQRKTADVARQNLEIYAYQADGGEVPYLFSELTTRESVLQAREFRAKSSARNAAHHCDGTHRPLHAVPGGHRTRSVHKYQLRLKVSHDGRIGGTGRPATIFRCLAARRKLTVSFPKATMGVLRLTIDDSGQPQYH